MKLETPDLAAFMAVLAEIPFVERVLAGPVRNGGREGTGGADARITIRAGGKAHRFLVEYKRVPALSRPLLEAFLARARSARGQRWILFAERVSSEQAEMLRSADVDFVDRAGNHRLHIGRAFHAYAIGRKAARVPRRGRALGVPGYRLLFALMARPVLLDSPQIRSVAAEAGVGKSTVADSLRRLTDEGLIARSRSGLKFVRPEKLLDRWLHGYAELLRPKLNVGRFEYEGDWTDLMRRWRHTFVAEREGHPAVSAPRWAWGGAFAARQLTRHLQAELALVHIERAPEFFVERARLAPSARGRLEMHIAPGPAAFERNPAASESAHPLLVYTELMTTGDERARETAHLIRSRYLGWLGSSR